MTQTRVTQVAAEGVVSPTPPSRVTQLAVESVSSPTPPSRVTQTVAEVLVANSPLSRFTQNILEVLVPNAPAVDLAGVTGQLWPRGGEQLPTVGPTGTAGGDLSGTYPNPTVAKIRGATVTTDAPTDGKSLVYRSASGKYELETAGGVAGSHYIYDPEAVPSGQTARTEEFTWPGTSGWPSGWAAITQGDFVSHDFDTTRPGALWVQGNTSENFFRGRGKQLIAASTDFCCLWRPWVAIANNNFGLMSVAFASANDASGGGGIQFWHGWHGSYGGFVTGTEKWGTAGSGAILASGGASTNVGTFCRARRVGTTVSFAIAPDGASWQEVSVSNPAVLGSSALYVIINFYNGGNGAAASGALSVFRFWSGTGMGVARSSGALVKLAVAA